MNDNDIIKAICRCIAGDCEENGCPLYNEADTYAMCVTKLLENTLAIINRQKAEIERLKGMVSQNEDVVRGEWIVTKTEFGWNSAEYPTEYTCSVCGRTERQTEPYCHCGARMDGERKELE